MISGLNSASLLLFLSEERDPGRQGFGALMYIVFYFFFDFFFTCHISAKNLSKLLVIEEKTIIASLMEMLKEERILQKDFLFYINE